MKLRLIASVVLTSFMFTLGSATANAASQAEVAALTAATAKVGGSSTEAIPKLSQVGKASGWSSPVAGAGVGLSGTWKVRTWDGKSGVATFENNVAGGALKDFKTYSFMASSKGLPAIVVLSKDKWFMPFKKSGTIVLVNLNNRRQWMEFSK